MENTNEHPVQSHPMVDSGLRSSIGSRQSAPTVTSDLHEEVAAAILPPVEDHRIIPCSESSDLPVWAKQKSDNGTFPSADNLTYWL
jgi:hypothetical protein